MTLGQVIRAARKRQGLTRRDVADALGVSRSTVAYWEGDQRRPSLGRLAALADVLGWQTEDIHRAILLIRRSHVPRR